MLKHKIKWTDKTVVITGSGSGIGRSVAIALAKKGATIHLIDLRQERITALTEELSAEPGVCNNKIHGHTIDVTNPEKLQQLATAIQNKVDILINCAGILHQGKIATAANKELHQVLDVNLWGAIYSIKSFLPLLKKSKEPNREQGSHIINIASIAGLIGAPEMAIYNASKSAILGLTESLAIELAADNIHVAAVCPGSVKTNLGRDGRFSSESTAAHILRSTIRSGVEPSRVAKDIIHVVEHSSLFKLSCVELHWQFLWLCKRLFPSLYPKLASTIYHKVLDKGWLESFLSLQPNIKHWLYQCVSKAAPQEYRRY
ncbi:MAG: SDR family NAD(P)-dependent oxidoreductase [Phormidesmis sp.]